MRSKYINKTINGFQILTSFSKTSSSGKKNSYFSVKCMSCGALLERARTNIISGEATCDCRRKQRSHNVRGMSDTRLNKVYRTMLERCENANCAVYKYYGGRGISVCKEWTDDFQMFYSWAILNGYKEGLTIDRIDNDGNYEPSNCQWATQEAQNKNRRKGAKL